MSDNPKRGRPPKKSIQEDEKILSENRDTLLMGKIPSAQKSEVNIPNLSPTVRQVYDSLGDLFNQSGGFSISDGLNKYNPFLQNARLKLISGYPVEFEPKAITDFLKSPQYHEMELRGASAFLAANQYLYYKILREAADIPLFLEYITPPTLQPNEYLTDKFEKEEEFVEEWIKTFDVPNTLKRIALETKRDGKSTYVFRQCLYEENGKKRAKYVTWQKLPSNFTKLTAIGEHGFIASFNMLIFLNPAFSPSQYPDFIQTIWRELIDNNIVYRKNTHSNYKVNIKALGEYTYNYNSVSTKGIIEISKDSYMYWVQLPQDLCFTFASDTSNAWVAPDTMGLFTALQELTDYSVLAGLVASTPLTAVLTGQAETCTNPQPGQDQTVISPHTLLALQNTFDSMASSNIQSFFAPLKDLKLQSLPTIPNATDIKTKAVQNFVSVAGEGGIIAATDKPTVAMTKGAQALAASQCDFVTRQFEAVLNMLLHKWTGVSYKWEIHLWGNIYSIESDTKLLKDLIYNGASFLLPQLASVYKLSMRQIKGINNYIEANKIYDLLRPLNASSPKQKTAGRPSLDDNEIINDSTAASKDRGDNVSEIKEFIAQNKCILCHRDVEEGQIICPICKEELGVEDEEEENV